MRPLRIFIVQPFQAKHSQRFKELIEEVCTDTGGRFESFRADESRTTAGPRLQDRIDSYIKRAHICVADMTGVTNENVLLEIGAAYTLGIPVIPVSDKDLPTDIRGNLWVRLTPNTLESEETSKAFRNQLKERLVEASLEIGQHHSTQFIALGYKNRFEIDFFGLVSACERRIDVLTTNLGFFVAHPLTDMYDRTRIAPLLDLIMAALPKKPPDFSMRVLALDPDSNFTNDRALGLGRDRQEFRETLRADLRDLISFVKSENCVRSFKVKVYEALPMQIAYFFDDVLVSSVVATERSSRDCVHYVHSVTAHGVRETYERQFDYLWGRGTQVANNPGASPRGGARGPKPSVAP